MEHQFVHLRSCVENVQHAVEAQRLIEAQHAEAVQDLAKALKPYVGKLLYMQGRAVRTVYALADQGFMVTQEYALLPARQYMLYRVEDTYIDLGVPGNEGLQHIVHLDTVTWVKEDAASEV